MWFRRSGKDKRWFRVCQNSQVIRSVDVAAADESMAYEIAQSLRDGKFVENYPDDTRWNTYAIEEIPAEDVLNPAG